MNKHASTAVVTDPNVSIHLRICCFVGRGKELTVAICVGAVLRGVQDHANELKDGDYQRAERDRAERER